MPDPVDPEACLRSLAGEVLLLAERDRPVFPLSLGVMAVANAFVMLGLLPEPQAEAILAELRLALEGKGFRNVWGITGGELTVRRVPTSTGRPGSPVLPGWVRSRCR